MSETFPEHVQAAFHADRGPIERLDAAWGYGWRVGQVCVSRALATDAAGWSARVREKLKVEGLRIARPLRSTDGRYVVSGWRASSWIEGKPARRVDEAVAAALRLDAELSTLSVALPEAKGKGTVFDQADRSATAGEDHGDALAARLIRNTPFCDAPDQICHADMLGTTIFHQGNIPALTDIVGTRRPRGYTAALCMIDGLITGAVDPGIIHRWRHIPHLEHLLFSALTYRVLVEVIDEHRDSALATDLHRVADILLAEK
ncbi:TIGR02569 family protein [Corynebacterium poyangense]|uniref:TIGR02569 family protein n=1 Tax=Corynebacterium poyangense TaxID=2684405 RepID=A0A7H0SML9_9CORY|nr:TIGR02569 family protein [Corynebacterium poyangense]MBZ8176900.1 TIGR02569 family protein [Corynebacterium poyangense]QNQ89794.1 TIGR02569 family protein [Corynebacterium poyangense]